MGEFGQRTIQHRASREDYRKLDEVLQFLDVALGDRVEASDVMIIFYSLICHTVAPCTTGGLRSPWHALMMAVHKHQNIVQWSYQQVPHNVVPRIPLYGYSRYRSNDPCQ